MAGADEDAGLSCGPVGPRVQRARALLTPGGAGRPREAPTTYVFIPSSPEHTHVHPMSPCAPGESLNKHPIP